MNKVNAVIFDMDGLMLDTESITFICYKEAFREYGYDMDKEFYKTLIGRNIKGTKECVLESYGSDFDFDSIYEEIDKKNDEYIKRNGVEIKKGLIELLKYLKDNNYKIAVATSTIREQAKELLESVGVINYFDGMVCGDDVINSKPDPEIFIKAASEINVHPKECMVLEDSGAGIEAAYLAGMVPINIPDMKEPDEDMKKKSYKILNNLLDVIELLEKENKK
ncbi:MAG: HAD family phosphatase [Clostridiales bacterium]|nr:HAD family phosphatase [Clostridiales bacterium]